MWLMTRKCRAQPRKCPPGSDSHVLDKLPGVADSLPSE